MSNNDRIPDQSSDEEPADWPRMTDDELESKLRKFGKDLTYRSGGESIAAKRSERVAMGYGNVYGRPLVTPSLFSENQLSEMSRADLEREFLAMQEICWDTKAKLDQFKMCVPLGLIDRDPYLAFLIYQGMEKGMTDAEIADETGEKVKFVQETRLYLLRHSPDLKGRPGAPRKRPKTP